MGNSGKKGGHGRLASPSLRQDALAAQWRSGRQHEKTPLSSLPEADGRRRPQSEPVPSKPMTGSDRGAVRRHPRPPVGPDHSHRGEIQSAGDGAAPVRSFHPEAAGGRLVGV